MYHRDVKCLIQQLFTMCQKAFSFYYLFNIIFPRRMLAWITWNSNYNRILNLSLLKSSSYKFPFTLIHFRTRKTEKTKQFFLIYAKDVCFSTRQPIMTSSFERILSCFRETFDRKKMSNLGYYILFTSTMILLCSPTPIKNEVPFV